mmetsp:Transcript_1771/g.2657  ORF Transcript_1771/g.2657 Transcript_1771/m.2657 type:complete len:192 (+) Transcript_1771:14-589(+)
MRGIFLAGAIGLVIAIASINTHAVYVKGVDFPIYHCFDADQLGLAGDGCEDSEMFCVVTAKDFRYFNRLRKRLDKYQETIEAKSGSSRRAEKKAASRAKRKKAFCVRRARRYAAKVKRRSSRKKTGAVCRDIGMCEAGTFAEIEDTGMYMNNMCYRNEVDDERYGCERTGLPLFGKPQINHIQCIKWFENV